MRNNTITFCQGDMTLDFSNINVPVTVISGATGCGKTYLVGEIIKYLEHTYNRDTLKIAEVTDAQQNFGDILQEINLRQELFAKNGCSSFAEFCNLGKTIPQFIVVIDMHFAQEAESKKLLSKIAEKAKTAGIHLIVVSQYPNIKGVTDLGYWIQRVIFTNHHCEYFDLDGMPQNPGSCIVCKPVNVL